jgi:hypothetical protein
MGIPSRRVLQASVAMREAATRTGKRRSSAALVYPGHCSHQLEDVNSIGAMGTELDVPAAARAPVDESKDGHRRVVARRSTFFKPQPPTLRVRSLPTLLQPLVAVADDDRFYKALDRHRRKAHHLASRKPRARAEFDDLLIQLALEVDRQSGTG